MSIGGILVLILALFLEYKVANLIWTEVIDIFDWVLLWEAMYISFLKIEVKGSKIIVTMPIKNMDIKYNDTK